MKATERRRDLLGRKLDRAVAFLLILTSLLGCVSTPTAVDSAGGDSAIPRNDRNVTAAPEGGLTPAEERMRRQSRAFDRTVWEGAFTGATAGTLLGAWVIHGLKGVVSAATAGSAAGGLAGAYLARKQQEYASAEDQLDSMVADVRKSNQEAAALIASIQTVIAEDRRRIAAVEERYRAGQASETQIAMAQKRLAANQAVVRDAAAGAQERHQMFSGAEQGYRTENPNVDTVVLKHELEAFRVQIDALGGLVDRIKAA